METRDSLLAMEWKKRYLLLEGKMRQFRLKAINIRSKLIVKLTEMNLQVKQAEEKVLFTENQLKLLQDSISDSTDSSRETENLQRKLIELEKRNIEQNQQIFALETQLENEKFLRSFDKQSVHDKALKIKDWVKNALLRAEKEQHDLQACNGRLNAAVKRMQERLTELIAFQSQPDKQMHGASEPASSAETGVAREKQQPREVDFLSSLSPDFHSMNTGVTFASTCDATRTLTSSQITNVYEVINDSLVTRDKELNVDETRDSLSKTLRFTSISKSERGSCATPSEDEKILSVDEEKLSALVSTASNKLDSDNSNSAQTHHNFMGTFDSIRKKFRGFTETHQKAKSPEDVFVPARGRDKQTKQKPSTEGRSNFKSRKSSRKLSNKNSVSKEKKIKVRGDFFQTNNSTTLNQLTASPLNDQDFPKAPVRNPPPTPPLHRMTSVELKIRDLMENGFTVSSSLSRKSSKTDSFNFNHNSGRYEEIVYKKDPFAVPVFSKVDRNLSVLIRPNPFSDASDSSDSETPSIPIKFSKNNPSRHFQGIRSSSSDAISQLYQIKNGSPANSRAMKRGNSRHSLTSSESDYAIPPDARSSPILPSDVFEPEHKLIKTSSRNSTLSVSRIPSPLVRRSDADAPAIKCGFLFKMSGKSRGWVKRWFKLTSDVLSVYQSPNDVKKIEASDFVIKTSQCVIERDDATSPAFRILYDARTFYLAADSSQSASKWITALQVEGASVTSGWVVLIISGENRRVWLRLSKKNLEFFKNETSQTPIHNLSLGSFIIEEEQLNLQSPLAFANVSSTSFEHVLVIRPIKNNCCDLYLSFETEKLKLSWMRIFSTVLTPLQLAMYDVQSDVTEFEILVSKVIQSSSKSSEDSSDTFWRHPVLSYSQQGVAKPLTSLSSEALKTEAVKIAKRIQVFTNGSLTTNTADYHITLIRCISQSCLLHAELRNEVYCQLIKETNRKSPLNDGNHSECFLQPWKLICLFIPVFLPQNEIFTFLKKYLNRFKNHRNLVGQHVRYCRRSLERAVESGGRSAPPSRTEALFVLFQNLDQHSSPLSLPVHFLDGSYEVVGFDCSSTVDELSAKVAAQSGFHDVKNSGFALFVDNPDVNSSLEHCIDSKVKICDVISTWETVVRRDVAVYKTIGRSQDGAADVGESPKFIFKRRLQFKHFIMQNNAKENFLDFYQLAHSISSGLMPLSQDLAVEVTSLMTQATCGNLSSNHVTNLQQVFSTFFPARYRGKTIPKNILNRIINRWEALEDMQSSECVRIVLAVARKWPLCYATFFLGQVVADDSDRTEAVWVAVKESSLSILKHFSMAIIETITFNQLLTFGGCQDQLLLVYTSSERVKKVLLTMNKVEMLELLNLVSDYINATVDARTYKIRHKQK